MRGRFITFEGGEGAGKSTQVRLLAERLAGAGVRVRTTREPGGSPFAEAARAVVLDPGTAPKSPLAAALLFYAARADHLEETIRPALEAGQWVVCDRFSDSTRAYQGAAGGVADADIARLEAMVVGATAPNLTILVDLDPSIGLARAGARRAAIADGTPAPDSFEARQLAFHARLRAGFLALAGAEPARFLVVDGTPPAATIADTIWQGVLSRLGPL
jgi:dTMP kinase